MKQITLTIEGMHCEMCESHICDCIRKVLPSSKKVKANHHRKTAVFLVDDDVNVSVASDMISKEGYHVLKKEEEPYVKKGIFSFLKK